MKTATLLNKLLPAVLIPIGVVSLAALPVGCGTYSLPAGADSGSGVASGGATGNPSGGTTGSDNGGTTGSESGGVTGNPTGGSSGNPTGGATATASGGAGGSASGGATGTPSGGATGNPTGGVTGRGGATATGGSTGAGGGTANGGTTGAGGATGAGGRTGAGGTTGVGGATSSGGRTGSGGTTGAGGATSSGGATGSGGTTGSGGSTGAGGSTTPAVSLPCDVLKSGGQTCVTAHSTVRVLISGYTGPLYQLCKGTANAGPSSCKGTMQDIGSNAGYADAATQDTFCAGATCTITKIYDQSGKGNDLEPAPRGGAKNTPDSPANAGDLKVTLNGHSAYGILIKSGIGYRTGCSNCNIKAGNGTAKGDEPQTMYMVTSQKDLVDGCCFDYGNAETSANDDGNGTMETIYFGGGVVWGTGSPGGHNNGPWVMADLENGLYAGWENNQDQNISTNKPLKFDYVTAVVLGDTQDKNSNKGRFALLGADATGADATYGKLVTMYDNVRPSKGGYVPMKKQGSIILGIGGDNSNGAGGRFYEGAVASGQVASQATLDALQAAIVAAKYGK